MATVQSLKKKLRSVRSTQKLSKAMKTASTVKFSRINALFSEYNPYSKQCEELYNKYRADFNREFMQKQTDAPICLIVMASNKGMCGAFNTELLSLAADTINNTEKPYTVILCGRQAELYFTEKGIPFDRSFVFGDVPSYEETVTMLDYVFSLLSTGKASKILTVYPQYKNMMTQQPVLCDILDLSDKTKSTAEEPLFFPDRETVIAHDAKRIMSSLIFKRVLETALGAQAATLMTMRKAYDTASDYCLELENAINRKRQSQVTADVLETTTEFSQKGE